jgi:proteic killer suppression protein
LLKVTYRNKTIMKVCTNYSYAVKTYGPRMAELIHLRIDQLESADSLETMVKYSIGRCHPLTGNRKGQYALDLVHPYRIIANQDKTDLQIVQIIEITDYH